MSKSLLKNLNQKIKKSDENLDVELEERGLSKDTGTYSDLGLDEDGITKESFHPDYEECFCRHDELSKMLNCIE